MMIKVIAAEIGKAGNMDFQTVKPMLRQAMAACLKRQMRDAGTADGLQRGMKADGVRCCQ
jgi:hypothetical protein